MYLRNANGGKPRLVCAGSYALMVDRCLKVPDGSATARVLDYSLKLWEGLTRYPDDVAMPIENSRVENEIRPWALGRPNWLFEGSLRSCQRAAVMTLVGSAKLNGHDPYAYLKRENNQRFKSLDDFRANHEGILFGIING